MPKLEEISYLDCISSIDPGIFILAQSAIELRSVRPDIEVGRNVGTTLLYYQGEPFPPVPASSEFKREFHGERLSLTQAIRRAVEEQWGPFKTIVRSPNQIPKSLTIEQIRGDAELLMAIKQLECIKIFSERAFCYYRNDTLDKGCLSYFESLEREVGTGKIFLFQSLPILGEQENKRRLNENIAKLKNQQLLIVKKKQILLEKVEIEKSFNNQMQPLKLLLGEKQKQYQEKGIKELLKDIERIQVIDMKMLRDERNAKLLLLSAREAEINQQLKEAFGLIPPRKHESTSTITAAAVALPSSSFAARDPVQQVSDSIQRKGLKTTQISQLVTNPDSFVLGTAVDDGGCFFDGLAQALNAKGGAEKYSEKSLRLKCHAYYLQNKIEVNAWNKKDYGGIDQGEMYMMVQYTKPELDSSFNQTPPIWGRPNIEGKILCRALNLEGILIIEMIKDPEDTQKLIPGFRIITANEEKQIEVEEGNKFIQEQRYPVLVVEQTSLHFVPLLSNVSLQLKQEGSTSTIAAVSGSSSSSAAAAAAYSSAEKSGAPLENPLLSRLAGAQVGYASRQKTGQDFGAKVPLLISDAKKAKLDDSSALAAAAVEVTAAFSKSVLSEEMTQTEADELRKKLTDSGIKSHLIITTSRMDDPNSYQLRVDSNNPNDIEIATKIIFPKKEYRV